MNIKVTETITYISLIEVLYIPTFDISENTL